MSEPRQCPRCGMSNPAGQRFCTNCGQKLAFSTPAASSSAEPSSASSGPSMGLPVPPSQGPLASVFRILRRILRLAAVWLPRIPVLGRLSTLLGVGELASINPFLSLGALGVAGVLGLSPSLYGHIDTTPFLYPFMALISSFNPALGMVAGVVFGAGDLIEKMLTNQIYYQGSP
ncbi:MAG: zinc ribbon domain-containing protein, partial [Anaerolineales bacterium]